MVGTKHIHGIEQAFSASAERPGTSTAPIF